MMSAKAATEQTYCVPAPKFGRNELLEWSVEFGQASSIYRGYVEYRCWVENDSGDSGAWEYVVLSCTVSVNGRTREYVDYDNLQESELTRVYPLAVAPLKVC